MANHTPTGHQSDGPREKLRAWKLGDPPLPQHVLDDLADLERHGKLSGADTALLRAYEASQGTDPPPPPPGDLGALLAQLEAYVGKAYASKASKRANPVSLAGMMKPTGGLQPGDVVVLDPGVYSDTYVLSQKVDGTAAAPIAFVGTSACVVTGVIAVDNPNTIAHGLVPSKGGRVRCGGFAVQVSFNQPG